MQGDETGPGPGSPDPCGASSPSIAPFDREFVCVDTYLASSAPICMRTRRTNGRVPNWVYMN